MSVQFRDNTVTLDGTCSIAEAELLLQHLLAAADADVDWRTCEWAHTSVIQILLASKAVLIGPPRGAFLQNFIEPTLARKQT
jgi:hypothetical protein